MSEFYEADVDHDGHVDQIEVDHNADGTDTYLVDTDSDGIANYEITADGQDVIEVDADTDGDGNYDVQATDTNGDGTLDHVIADTDGDGVVDYEGGYANA